LQQEATSATIVTFLQLVQDRMSFLGMNFCEFLDHIF